MHAHAGLKSAENQKRPSQTTQTQKSSVHTGTGPRVFG
jgi:hypothetical protein